jgi:cell division protein FtsL
MRGFVTFLAAFAVVALGYWAYHQNILTQQSLREVDRLQRSIGLERENLGVLRAEWAYLNRPDRLRELVDLNFDRLGLLPMSPGQFAVMDEIVWRSENQPEDAVPEAAENVLYSASETVEPL